MLHVATGMLLKFDPCWPHVYSIWEIYNGVLSTQIHYKLYTF